MADGRKLWLGEPDRHARLRRIRRLDLRKDYLQIAGLTSGDFRSILFAVPFAGFMTTFAAPRMSRILYGTGEITQRFAKRAIDTMLFSKAIHVHGFGTPEGRAAAKRVHALHAQYDIDQDDFILVGCDPLIFILDLYDRYGWRPLLPVEREAQRRFFDHQARAFGARRPLPKSEAEMRVFVDHYFDTQLKYEPQNGEMAKLALDWFSALAPKPIRPMFRTLLLSTLDPRVTKACGMVPPGPLGRAAAWAMMTAMARRDPMPDGGRDMLEQLARTVYPDGYTFDELGPKAAEPVVT